MDLPSPRVYSKSMEEETDWIISLDTTHFTPSSSYPPTFQFNNCIFNNLFFNWVMQDISGLLARISDYSLRPLPYGRFTRLCVEVRSLQELLARKIKLETLRKTEERAGFHCQFFLQFDYSAFLHIILHSNYS